MSKDQPTMTQYLGKPDVLKQYSMEQIEHCLSAALTQMTEQRLVVSINHLEIETWSPAQFGGAPAKVQFDVTVVSEAKEVPAPF